MHLLQLILSRFVVCKIFFERGVYTVLEAVGIVRNNIEENQLNEFFFNSTNTSKYETFFKVRALTSCQQQRASNPGPCDSWFDATLSTERMIRCAASLPNTAVKWSLKLFFFFQQLELCRLLYTLHFQLLLIFQNFNRLVRVISTAFPKVSFFVQEVAA